MCEVWRRFKNIDSFILLLKAKFCAYNISSSNVELLSYGKYAIENGFRSGTWAHLSVVAVKSKYNFLFVFRNQSVWSFWDN